MSIDDSSALAVLNATVLYAKEGWIVPAQEAVKQTILAETSVGRDSNDEPFEDWGEGQVYSPSQAKVRKAAGVTLSVKNLQVEGELLSALKPRVHNGRPVLSVAESGSDKLNRIAHGLMFHPKWRYHMKFLDAGRACYTAVMLAIKGAF